MKTATATANARKLHTLTLWVDLDELEYNVNINEGPVPDASFASYDEAVAWCNGYEQALRTQGVEVCIKDISAEA